MVNKLDLSNGVLAGTAIASNVLDAEHLKAGNEYDRIIKEIQQIENPLERIPAFTSAMKQMLEYKNQYWLILGANLKMILREKTSIDRLLEDGLVTIKDLKESGLPESGEVDNWKLSMTSYERKNLKEIVNEWGSDSEEKEYISLSIKKRDKEWFTLAKLGMNLTAANQIIYIIVCIAVLIILIDGEE